MKLWTETDYLLGKVEENPGYAIANIINSLTSIGSAVIGIPCNTAHARPIHDVIRANIDNSCTLINMIEEVGKYLNFNHPNIRKVGLLATNGTIASKVYSNILKLYNIEVISPSKENQEALVHRSIFDHSYGIKSFSDPIKPIVQQNLLKSARILINEGAELIVLGCTELPLAIRGKRN